MDPPPVGSCKCLEGRAVGERQQGRGKEGNNHTHLISGGNEMKQEISLFRGRLKHPGTRTKLNVFSSGDKRGFVTGIEASLEVDLQRRQRGKRRQSTRINNSRSYPSEL